MCPEALPASRLFDGGPQFIQSQPVLSTEPFLRNKLSKWDSANRFQEIVLGEVPFGSRASSIAIDRGVENHRQGGNGAGVVIVLRNVKRHKPPEI